MFLCSDCNREFMCSSVCRMSLMFYKFVVICFWLGLCVGVCLLCVLIVVGGCLAVFLARF